MPEMKPIYSSHIEAIGYDGDTAELHVQFKGGKTAAYQDVPADIAQQVMGATSVGSALNLLIKNTYEFNYI